MSVRSVVLGVLRAALFALVLPIGAGAAVAADRHAIVTEGADYFGRDIETRKDVSVEDCEAACVANEACKAFTYNVKARWCFMKADFGDLRQFAGAISGRIVEGAAPEPDLEATRVSELTFVPTSDIDDARKLLGVIQGLEVAGTLDDAVTNAVNAAMRSDLVAANDLYKYALSLAPDRFDLWEAFSAASLAATSNDWQIRDRLANEGMGGAILAYFRAVTPDEQARALKLVAEALAKRETWKAAIQAARTSLAYAENAAFQTTLDEWVAQHGFRITENTVDTEAEVPRICATFSEDIAADDPRLLDFVAIDGGDQLDVDATSNQICASGVDYGQRYRMTLRQGLPAADPNEALLKTVDLDFYISDRAPQVRFVGRGYVVPRHAGATIPVTSVNVDVLNASVYRIGDRSLVQAIGEETFLSQLGTWETEDIASRRGEEVWKGTVEVRRRTNQEVTTAIPVGELVKDFKPGVYALMAIADNDKEEWGQKATQWFVVTDIGLSTMTGNDGLHVVARTLSGAAPVGGAELKLVAVNNDVLGTAKTDAEGYARFDPGLVRGTGGNAPALIEAALAGDYAFLDLTKPAFDLSDRGVEGRDPPKPVDVWMTTERGVYRPGEVVNVTALARDGTAKATADLPLTLVLMRPDGVEQGRRLLADQGAGGRSLAYELPQGAMRGTWRAALYTDPKGNPVREATFLVEDFLPERIDFKLDLGLDHLTVGESASTAITAEWLYGAPAAGLGIEGEVYVTKAPGLKGLDGWIFGLVDEEFTPIAEPVVSDGTGEDGTAEITLNMPDVSSSTAALQAAVHVRVLDTNGRPVERRVTLPVAADKPRVGVRPAFDGEVQENGNARFAVGVFDDTGAAVDQKGLSWALSRVETRYQWYNSDGSWNYQAIKSTEEVANGTVDLAGGVPADVEAKVTWGEYQFEVWDENGEVLPVSTRFYAGWYVSPTAEDTPDLLKLTLDKPTYKVGDTLTARILPRFPGVAVVQVVDDRLVDMKTVEVTDEGATVSFPVTDAWGPGAYVTATLIRPLDVEAKRMPQRALGLTWASVDPGDRILDVSLAVPSEQTPRGPLPVEVALANVAPGEDAYVTVAAIDAGILNLTSFEPPAPEDWYFAQRRLGVEFRDLYGKLVDTTIGDLGTVRSGGDGSGVNRLLGPPPTEKLVAFFQGVTKVGPDGKAKVSFDVPDFNGTIRVMAVAWSKTAVGHASADVKVRDPVVVLAALPNFLAPGDRSRLRLDVTHVDGPSGDFKLEVAAAGDLVAVEGGDKLLTLADKASTTVLVPLSAKTVGDETLTVTLTGPDGKALTKTLTVPVRANEPPVLRVSEVSLKGSGGRMTIGPDLVADMVPATTVATVTVGSVGGIDVPGLVHQLDKYPYGCTEQITSRALPLVYLDDVVLAAGLTGETPVKERVQKAIDSVLVNQGSNGSFGLWAPGNSEDLWLDAYVTDFLTRAKEKGYQVPAVAWDLAVTNLRNRLAYAPDFTSGGEDVAYALYVLARNGRASIGDLRYYAESKLDAFTSPLSRAQLGAALALYGETRTSDTVFRSAVGLLDQKTDTGGWRADYGSDLRDGAAILTLVSETGSKAVDRDAVARELRNLARKTAYRSTQEQAWMLLAANALMTEGQKPIVEVDGVERQGVFTARYSGADLAAGEIQLLNKAAYPIDGKVTVRGVPVTPEPAGGNLYGIQRRYYGLDGAEVDPSTVKLGDRLAVVVTVTTTNTNQWARLMVDDPLPAGFQIDNPNLLTGADVANLSWLTLANDAARAEFRADRFLAAYTLNGNASEFSLGYMVRAVAPGSFAHPAATVEDMYRPEERARTASGHVEVVGPLQ